jgi:hypothetical protein
MASSVTLLLMLMLLLSRVFAAKEVQLWEFEGALLGVLCSILADPRACCCLVWPLV